MATTEISSSYSSSTSSSSTTQLDQLVEAYRQTRQSELDTLTSKKTEIEGKMTFYSVLRNRVSAVTSELDKYYRVKNDSDDDDTNDVYDADFKEKADKLVSAKKVTSSDEDFVTATASSSADTGINDIRVNRLATNDQFTSRQITLENKTTIEPGTITYTVKVLDDDGELTDADGNKYNNVDLKIKIAEDDTNESVMKKIVSAVNGKSDLNFSASFMKDTDTTGRVVFTAKEAGAENQVDLSFLTEGESANSDLNSMLGLDNINSDRTSISTDVTAAKFRIADTSELNSKLVVNGIEVTKSTNSIDDLLPGVTITLKQVHEDDDRTTTLTTTNDSKTVITNITNAIDSYNQVITHLKENTSMLRSDSGTNSLLTKLRNLATTYIEPEEPDPVGAEETEIAPKYITNLGFEVGSDGTLSISDSDVITELLESDGGSQKISWFFNSENGFMSKLYKIISDVTDDDGLIKTRTKSLQDQLDANADKITTMEDRIDTAAESMRKQYTSILETYNEQVSQYETWTKLLESM